ncbi:MAG: ROK family transcriptional regulator [Acidimicrobiales bacterium]
MTRGWGQPGRTTSGPARAELLRQRNLALVLGAIARAGRCARAQLAERTGLTKATVSSLADVLISSGLVVEGDPDRGLVGRPGSPLGLDPRGPVGLGVEVNVDYVSACVVDLAGEVRASTVLASENRGIDAREVCERAARLARSLLSSPPVSGLRLAGLGVALPGLVDTTGVLRRAPNLRDLEGIAAAAVIAELLSEPPPTVACGNEANLAALAELWFADREGRDDFVRVSGEIGVGAGIVIGGELWQGTNGLAGEIGHVFVDPGGPRCTCGARGCLEHVAGQEALLRAAGAYGGPATALGSGLGSVHELVTLARGGDGATLDALERAGTALGVALAAVVNVVDVPIVILGGLYADIAPWLARALVRELEQRVVSYPWAPTEVAVSSLGAGAAVRGAAGLAIRAVLDDPASWHPDTP